MKKLILIFFVFIVTSCNSWVGTQDAIKQPEIPIDNFVIIQGVEYHVSKSGNSYENKTMFKMNTRTGETWSLTNNEWFKIKE